MRLAGFEQDLRDVDLGRRGLRQGDAIRRGRARGGHANPQRVGGADRDNSATRVSRSSTAMVSPRRTARRYLADRRLQLRDPHCLHDLIVTRNGHLRKLPGRWFGRCLHRPPIPSKSDRPTRPAPIACDPPKNRTTQEDHYLPTHPLTPFSSEDTRENRRLRARRPRRQRFGDVENASHRAAFASGRV